MNCERAERWMLLEQSGELRAGRRRRLAAHLADCADCASYRAALHKLTDQARSDTVLDALDPSVLTGIREGIASASGAVAALPREPMALPLLRLAATAVATVVVVSGFFSLYLYAQGANGPGTPTVARATLSQDYDWLDVEMDLLSDEMTSLSKDAPGTTTATATHKQDLDGIATELLKLEGMEI